MQIAEVNSTVCLATTALSFKPSSIINFYYFEHKILPCLLGVKVMLYLNFSK